MVASAEAGITSGRHHHVLVGRELRAAQLMGEEGDGEAAAWAPLCEADGAAAGMGRPQQEIQAGGIKCRPSPAWVIGSEL